MNHTAISDILIETQIFKPLKGGLIYENKNPNPFVEGILATVGETNGNGRVYSREIWEPVIERYISGPIRENRATGELDHSDTEIIELKNVSHIIRKVWWDGDYIMGKIEILPTPMGNIAKALIENNVQIGISSRGTGSVEQMGEILEVQDDFDLICWDFVSEPSNKGSWLKQTHSLNEGLKSPSINIYNKYKNIDLFVNNIIRNL